MRPGQAAPVFIRSPPFSPAGGSRFNEAGAGCPGIRIYEAPAAILAGASMRPGQAAPVFKQRHSDDRIQLDSLQ